MVGLTKRFRTLVAVDHVTFEVKQGEIFGLLGPNGAGKTTTIRMLVGLTPPSAGTAVIHGYNLQEDLLAVKRCVGVVPETSNLYEELTVWQNLLFMTRLYHVPKPEREQRICSLLQTFDLWEKRRVKFGKLSRGLKRRSVVAAALVHNPELVFLDEPTTGLDVQSARSLRRLLIELQRTGLTVFLTTHYIEEADLLCDRIALIVSGKLRQIESPAGLKALIQNVPRIEASFTAPLPVPMIERLKAVGEVHVTGKTVQISTPDVTNALEALTTLSKESGRKLESVSTAWPSLEDAFVKLTGVPVEMLKVEKERGGR